MTDYTLIEDGQSRDLTNEQMQRAKDANLVYVCEDLSCNANTEASILHCADGVSMTDVEKFLGITS